MAERGEVLPVDRADGGGFQRIAEVLTGRWADALGGHDALLHLDDALLADVTLQLIAWIALFCNTLLYWG